MGPKKQITSQKPADSKAEKQFKEERIAREMFQAEAKTQLPKSTQEITDINDEKATLVSMINNKTLVPPENPRDPGSQLYRRIVYVFGMTPKLMGLLRRLRNFTEEEIDEHINWFNDTFDANVTRVKEINYKKTTFGPRMSGLHQHTKLMNAESKAFNESKLIQQWVDKKIEYPYTPLDLGNRKYKQTIARAGFTEDIIKELIDRGFNRAQIDKHIKYVRQKFGFNIRKTGKRGKQTLPSTLPDIVFLEKETESVTTTTIATTTSTTSSATPATSSTVGIGSVMEQETGNVGQTIGSVIITGPENVHGEGEQLPIISSVISMSTMGRTDDPETMETELEYVSTVTKGLEKPSSTVELTSLDLEIKKEMVEEDLHPGDPEFYLSLQYVYQNLKETERIVENSRNTPNYMDNLKKCSSIKQIFESMKSAYSQHAQRMGKILPEGWDTVKLVEPVPPRVIKGVKRVTDDDPDYQPIPIYSLSPITMSMRQIDDYVKEFEKELEELKELRETGPAKDYTQAKMERRTQLEEKIAQFEIEKENRIAKMGESRRPEDTEEEVPEGQGSSRSPWERTKPKKGTYPAVGPNGPGDLNVPGDWEGPIELFEFENMDEGWIDCTTGYYWHKVPGGGICQFNDEWYRNWEFDYEPPADEVVEDTQLENPEIPQALLQEPIPVSSGTTGDPVLSVTEGIAQQMTQKAKELSITLTPEEAKTRENNIAHIAHLGEEMKKLVEKWKEEAKHEKDGLKRVVIEMNIDKLNQWLDHIRIVLKATTVSPMYIPTVRQVWIDVVKQKEGLNESTKKPTKSEEPKTAKKSVAKKSGIKRTGGKVDPKKSLSSTEGEPGERSEDPVGTADPQHPEENPEGPLEDPDPPQLEEDPGLPGPPPSKKPKIRRPKPKGSKPKGDTLSDAESRSTAGENSGTKSWSKTGYDTRKTGSAAVPPEGLLDVTRKRKAGPQPKPSTSEGGSASKRKRTVPSKWLPHTQPRSTYMMGDKITPVWGLIHKGSMNPTEDWRIPIYQPPKLTDRQKALQQEAKKQERRYRRYKPGQLALKEIKYYSGNEGFIIPISAIRRLCLEIGYEYKERISFQLHAYRLLQESAEWYLTRIFKDTNLLAAHAKRITIKTKDMVLARKVSGDYGLYNTWAWNSENLSRPWAYEGKLDPKQREIRRHYLGNKREYKKQTWKVKTRRLKRK